MSAWDPETYPGTIRAEIADYELLQEKVVEATGTGAATILELGTGAGETAGRLLQRHPDAFLVGIDSSPEMLRGATAALPADRVQLHLQDLADPLPAGDFDRVVSALAVHHLQGEAKEGLFSRVHAALVPGGTFVLGDVVVPVDPADAVIENEPGYDFPSTVDEQLAWLSRVGFETKVHWQERDLAVIVSSRSS